VNKILIDAPAWVGDAVMAQCLFIVLKQQFPQAEIHVLATDGLRSVFARMPEIDRIWIAPEEHGRLALRARFRLAKELRQERFDHAIILRNSLKSALIPFLARIPVRIGWLGEKRYGLLNQWRVLNPDRYPRMIDRFMALGLSPRATLPAKPHYPQLMSTHAQIQHTLLSLGLTPPSRPLLILCPGAEYGPAKRWPAAYFAQVANKKIKQGWIVWILGSAKEAGLAAAIAAAHPKECVDLTGKTRLDHAIDLLSLADCVVSNDSGLMHMAAARQRPLVVIYGSSSKHYTPPLSQRVMTLSRELSCSPCFQRQCPLKHMDCLTQLLPETVLAAIDRVYKESAHEKSQHAVI
jgi:heptosyltransferase-2